MLEPLNDLVAELDALSQWPPPRERMVRSRVSLHRALRRSDTPALKRIQGVANDETYITDPLPRLISTVFADLLFGTDPEIVAAVDSDQARLDEVVAQLPASLRPAEEVCTSEGEVWWRIYVDRAARPAPIVQFVSRLCVVPLIRGGRVVACAFVTTLGDDGQWGDVVLRHVEVHGDGVVLNLLYRGTSSTLGRRVPLSGAVVDLPEVWAHGLEMLAGRVLNARDDNDLLGRSDFVGAERLLLSLNEAATIAAHNARLTMRQRIYADTSVLDPQTGRLNVQDDVVITNAQGGTLGDDSSKTPPVRAVELSFDAQAMTLYINELTDRILTRVSVSPQLAGRSIGNVGHGPESGAALRARMMQSVLAAEGKGRFWDDDVPRLIALMAQVDQLPEQEGGFGTRWAAATEPPSFERGSVLPEDDQAEVDRHSAAVLAEIESRETAVASLHPDWTPLQVADELARIRGDVATAPAVLPDTSHLPAVTAA